MKAHILLGVSTLAVIALPAFAQDAPQLAEAPAEASESIIVTGSRIARPNVDASVPVTSLTAAELTQSGEVSLGDRIALLPSFRPTFTSQNSGRFIGTAGVDTLDLRGQGTSRTLVLQNGRRHVTSSPGTSQVDVATMPTGLLERVDVVTGGNSAIYGSDAVAGVVNFITKRDYEGIEARGQMGISSRGDRPAYSASLTAGKNFSDGRGNIAISLEYSEAAPLFLTERDGQTGAFSGRTQFQLTQDTVGEPAAGNGVFDTTLISGIKNAGISTGGAYTSSCTGTAPARRALNCSGVFNTAGTTQFGNVFVFAPDGTLVQNVGRRDFRPFGSGNFEGGLGSTLRETGLLQVGTTRYSGNVLASFEVSEGFRPFFEGKFVRTQSIQEGQPTFSSGALNPTFQLTNPFLTAQARDVLTRSLAPGATGFTMQRFNTDFGGRGENHERDLYRIVVGADGTFFDTWRYEVAFNYGRVDTFYQTRGNVNTANFTRAANAVRNSGGQIVCAVNADADPTNDAPACAPIDLFGQSRASQAALD